MGALPNLKSLTVAGVEPRDFDAGDRITTYDLWGRAWHYEVLRVEANNTLTLKSRLTWWQRLKSIFVGIQRHFK